MAEGSDKHPYIIGVLDSDSTSVSEYLLRHGGSNFWIERIEISDIDSDPYSSEEIKKYLDKKEEELALLDRASHLRKRFWKYKDPSGVEVWATRHIAIPIAYLFPKERREEWLGDLYEGNQELINQGYSQLVINLINTGTTIVLIFSALSIKVSDLISSALQRQK